ncbi:hypothetical protein C0995_010412 [Termitomyces sp. Mi166|nr:hypothetical protein C0995_010412 [Termitomyces sp. Mi166\
MQQLFQSFEPDRDPYPSDEVEELEPEFSSEKFNALLLDEARLALDANDSLSSSLREGGTPPAKKNVELAESARKPTESAESEEQVKISKSTRRKDDITDEVVDSEKSENPVGARTGTKPLVKRKNEPEDKLLPLKLPSQVKEMDMWFTPPEFVEFIRPLYQRGWQMGFRKILSIDVVSHILTDRVFTFQTWKEAMEFVFRVNDIAKKDFHDPHSVNIQYKGKVVQVTMTLVTHSGRRGKWVRRDNEPLKAPGVTRQDLRLAMRIERLYTDKFGGGAPSVLPPVYRQPPIHIIHKLLNLPPRKLQHYCTACGERHSHEECTASDTGDAKRFLPWCPKCQQRHAPMAVCPKRRDMYVSAPRSPCPNCGGAHWLEDCRKPQLPHDEAQALMLPLTPEMILEE